MKPKKPFRFGAYVLNQEFEQKVDHFYSKMKKMAGINYFLLHFVQAKSCSQICPALNGSKKPEIYQHWHWHSVPTNKERTVTFSFAKPEGHQLSLNIGTSKLQNSSVSVENRAFFYYKMVILLFIISLGRWHFICGASFTSAHYVNR